MTQRKIYEIWRIESGLITDEKKTKKTLTQAEQTSEKHPNKQTNKGKLPNKQINTTHKNWTDKRKRNDQQNIDVFQESNEVQCSRKWTLRPLVYDLTLS